MKINLKYHKSKITIKLKFPNHPNIISLPRAEIIKSEEDILKQALHRPLGKPALHKILRRGERTTIVVPDRTRNCNVKKCLPLLINEISRAGINNNDITILIANGTHPPQNDQEKIELLGEEIFHRYRTLDHDCKNQSILVYLGKTCYNTSLFINKCVVKAERLILIGGVKPHYFAGYGGGPKLINPGCASYETILQNHRLMIDRHHPRLQPACCDGNINGNPVYEDILDSIKFFQTDFSVQLVLNEDEKIVAAFSGSLELTHKKACESAAQLFLIPINKKADLVICSCGGLPYDINLIQAHKTIQHAYYATKDNGAIIVAAACNNGIGSSTFEEWFQCKTLAQMHRAILANFKINSNTALSLKYKTERVKIILISELDDNLINKFGMIAAHSIDEAYSIASSFLPKDFTTTIIPHGAHTVPTINWRQKNE